MELLDDEAIVRESLNNKQITAYAIKIANRVWRLSIFFGIFSLCSSIVTLDAYQRLGRNYSGEQEMYYFAAAILTQIGVILLTIRLFLYQASLRHEKDWRVLFTKKYKLWQSFAIVLLLSLTSISLFVLKVNNFF